MKRKASWQIEIKIKTRKSVLKLVPPNSQSQIPTPLALCVSVYFLFLKL
jgi:hypothetical protein